LPRVDRSPQRLSCLICFYSRGSVRPLQSGHTAASLCCLTHFAPLAHRSVAASVRQSIVHFCFLSFLASCVLSPLSVEAQHRASSIDCKSVVGLHARRSTPCRRPPFERTQKLQRCFENAQAACSPMIAEALGQCCDVLSSKLSGCLGCELQVAGLLASWRLCRRARHKVPTRCTERSRNASATQIYIRITPDRNTTVYGRPLPAPPNFLGRGAV
jgi:hypothetical protein